MKIFFKYEHENFKQKLRQVSQSDLQKGNTRGCSSGRQKTTPDGSLKL